MCCCMCVMGSSVRPYLLLCVHPLISIPDNIFCGMYMYINSPQPICSQYCHSLTDSAHDLGVTDISSEWVLLSWKELSLSCGPSDQQYNVTYSCNETTSTITTTGSTYNITDLIPTSACSCTVVAVLGYHICSLHSPQVSFTPG